MKTYTIYYRSFDSVKLYSVTNNAESIENAIGNALSFAEHMNGLLPEEVDICHVQVTE